MGWLAQSSAVEEGGRVLVGVLEAVPAEPTAVRTGGQALCRPSPRRRRSSLRSASIDLAGGVVVVSNLDHTCEQS